MNQFFSRRLPLYKKEKKPVVKSESADIWGHLKSAAQLLGVLGFLCFILLYVHLKRQTYVFDYTQVPEELKKMGYTEEFITRNINDMMGRIVRYEGSFRLDSKEKGIITQFTSLSSLEVSKLDNVNIQGVPFKSLITLTDRLLKPLGVDTDNYVSLEFLTNSDTLTLIARYRDNQRLLMQSYNKKIPYVELNVLCLDAAIFLLEQSNPIALSNYYFGSRQYPTCIKLCQSLLHADNLSPNEKSTIGYFLAQSMHVVKGNYVDDDQIHREKDFAALYEEAIAYDSSNVYVKEKLLDLQTTSWEKFADTLYTVLRNNIEDSYLTARYLEARISECDSSDFIIDPILDYYREFVRLQGTQESEFYWRIGKAIENVGYWDPRYYDLMIELYNKALDVELASSGGSRNKISEYYNAIAYAYQLKAFCELSHESKKPFKWNFSRYKKDSYVKLLEQSHYYSHLGIMNDSLNYWAWSTHGEYMGLIAIHKVDTASLRRSMNSLSNAVKYEFDIDEDVDQSEPYHTLARLYQTQYQKLKETPSYYDGNVGRLRRLMHR